MASKAEISVARLNEAALVYWCYGKAVEAGPQQDICVLGAKRLVFLKVVWLFLKWVRGLSFS